MEYEVGLAFSGAMSRLKVKQWIRSMEDYMKINKVGSEDMVPYVVNHLVEEAATWWRTHQAIDESQRKITWKEFTRILLGSRLVTPTQRTVNLKRPRACKICGEIGHSYEEHQHGCPYCEEIHSCEECPTAQVTCFMCEGTDHYPAQCRIFIMTQQVIQHQKEGMKKAIQELKEAPVKKIKNDISQIQCYRCRNMGHYANMCSGLKEAPVR